MNEHLIKEFREKWHAVVAVEAEEQKTASVHLRWRQINAILRMAIELEMPLEETDGGEEEVRLRWAKLKGLQR